MDRTGGYYSVGTCGTYRSGISIRSSAIQPEQQPGYDQRRSRDAGRGDRWLAHD
jgi:hypothetical protein